MRGATVLFVILFFAGACRESPAKPLSEPGERLYSLRGVIVSRNTGDNSLRLKHEEVAGFMAAMTMDFSVRGADLQELPADGKRVEAKLHVTDRAFWITDVTPIP